jgi:EipB-like
VPHNLFQKGAVEMSQVLRTLFGSMLAGAALCGAAEAGGLAAHRAIYDLEVSRIDSKSGYSSIEGKLAYELTGSPCEGYAVNYRLANRYVQAEKGARVLDTQLTTWESGDGLEMNLSQKQFVDSNLDSEERFNIKRPKAGEQAKGSFTLPKPLDFSVDAAALFPSAHQEHLLDVAQKGLNRDASFVFDGSDGEKIYKAISFIGKKRAPGSFAVDKGNPQTEPLRGLSSWPITISYYSTGENASEQPVYQAGFNMYDNGISTDLTMDYGTYALKGTLTKLDILKADSCK